jgi:hypothetical protein
MSIKEVHRSYIQIVREENPDVKILLINLGAGNSSLNDIFEQLIASFQLG